MIEALKTDELVAKAGGRFKLCALIQRRLVEFLDGARPLVERDGRSDLELVIEEIMQERSKFGGAFTKEVDGQLTDWGVCTVKNIELMDIRDSEKSFVIQNIMKKKRSHIEMESRTEVAKNHRSAAGIPGGLD